MAIKHEKAKGDFTSFGGLSLFDQVFSATKLKSKLKDFMPTGQRITADKSYNKFLGLIYGSRQ